MGRSAEAVQLEKELTRLFYETTYRVVKTPCRGKYRGYNAVSYTHLDVYKRQAVELKKASQEGKLTKEKIEQAVAPTKREETPPLKITLMEEDLRPYFPDKRTTIPDVKRGVLEALDLRKKALERQKAKAQADKDGKKKPEPSR